MNEQPSSIWSQLNKIFTWWSDSDDVDPRIPGFTTGILEENSGTFDDIANRGGGEREDDFTAIRWYNKNRPDYAIDATLANVIAQYLQLIPTFLKTIKNAFTFARA